MVFKNAQYRTNYKFLGSGVLGLLGGSDQDVRGSGNPRDEQYGRLDHFPRRGGGLISIHFYLSSKITSY